MKKLHTNLTQGNVTKLLIKFAIPFLIANILQALYGIVDMIVVGQFVDTATSSAGTSALTISSQVMMLANSVVIGLATGGTVLISQYIGAGKHEKIEKAIGTFLSVFMITSVIVSIIMLISAEPLLRLLDTPKESFDGALVYLRVSSAGMIFIFGYNALAAILRGMGDSKRPMYFIVAATIVNIGLDVLFVGPMEMGVFGAALATITAQAVSFLLAIIYLVRSHFSFELKLTSFKIDGAITKLLIRLGLPSAVQQGLVQSSFLVLASIVNSYGQFGSSAAGIASKVNGIAILPAVAFSTAISSMAGQNIGAGFYDRAKQTLFAGIKALLPLVTVIFIFVFIFSEQIIGLFTTNPEVAKIGVDYLRLSSLEYFVLSVLFCAGGLITGAGFPMISLINTSISSFILRIPLAYWLSSFMGLNGVAISISIAPIGALIFAGAFIMSGKWKQRRIVESEPAIETANF